jgi:hypothetical protein
MWRAWRTNPLRSEGSAMVRGSQEISDREEVESRVLQNTSSPHCVPRPNFSLRLRRWYSHSALRLLIVETSAARHRIRWVLGIQEAELRHGTEEVHALRESCGVSGPCTPDYILYMQHVEARFPFLSTFDRLLLSQAWRAGSESGVRNHTEHSQYLASYPPLQWPRK